MEPWDIPCELLPHIASRVRKGAGCGDGADYRPWNTFRNRHGHGSNRLFKCSLTGRRIDLPSEAHIAYFFLWERSPNVVSIKECVPILDVRETLELFAEFGLRHPMVRGMPEPLTLDFLIHERNAEGQDVLHARTLSSSSPDTPRATPLDVLHEICRRRGIGWKVVKTDTLSDDLLSSLRYARGWMRERFRPMDGRESRFSQEFMQGNSSAYTLRDTLAIAARKTGCPSELALQIFRYSAWTGLIPVDFRWRIRLDRPVRLLPGA